jgi:hypothetical protein
MSGSVVLRAVSRLQHEARRILEDPIVRERDAETDGGGGDPTIGVVISLSQGMTGALAIDAELGVGRDEVGTGVDDLRGADPGVELHHPGPSPMAEHGAVPELPRRRKRLP